MRMSDWVGRRTVAAGSGGVVDDSRVVGLTELDVRGTGHEQAPWGHCYQSGNWSSGLSPKALCRRG